jgi:hypothetical protein
MLWFLANPFPLSPDRLQTPGVIVHGTWTIPDSWVHKRLACLDADTPPSQSLPPLEGGQVGGLNDYHLANTLTLLRVQL